MKRVRRSSRSIAVALCCLAAATADAFTAQAPPVDLFGLIAVPRVTQKEFRALHEDGSVLVIDVRPEVAYRAGHIPGAISVPLASVAERAAGIRARAGSRRVVTYCSCPAEHTSVEAAKILMKHGVGEVSALVGGYLEWVRAGGALRIGERAS